MLKTVLYGKPKAKAVDRPQSPMEDALKAAKMGEDHDV